MSSAQDLPFSCEYAKSGRSSCKSCRQKIDKDTLRLGIMVQSPVFDGKIPNWYHSTCFWKAARLQNIGDLHGFDKLRWEDQETVKKKITGASSSVSSGALKNPSVNDFSIEYSKSSRAACKICFAKILKNEIRISCKDYESKYGKMMGGTDAWHHLSCFADNIEKLEFYENPEKISGFGNLSMEDQKLVKNKIIPKKKRKQENDLVSEEEESPKKRPKKYQNPLDMEEEALKEQNKAFWAIRDQLQRKANKKEMVSILEANGQQVPHGETRIMDSLADIMLFGPLKQCTECGNGQLVYSSSQNTYVCKGFVSEFTGCLFKTQDPARRKKFLVPPDLDQHEYFSKFKFVAGRKRIFPSQRPVSTSSQSIDGAADVADKALYGQKFVLGGEKFSRSRQEISDKIRNLGGDIVATLKDSVLAVISSDKEKGEDWKGASAEVKKLLKKAEKFNVPVVDEQFLNSLKSASQVELMIQQYSLVDWGTKEVKEKMRKSKLEKIEKSSAKSDAAWTKSVPVSQKLVMKGGAAVDPSCEAAEFTHVWKHNAGCLYTVTLNKVDVHRDINSYYKLQLLEHDKHRKYYLFRSWGRIGTTVGGTLLEEFGVEFEDAQEEFKRLYLEKTGNEWEDRKHFQKRPQKFFPVDLDYGEDEKPKKKGKVAEGSRSNLPLAVQELVKLIFDVEQMKQTMKEFEIDLKKMPLGKLSKKQIRDAYKVLGDLQKLMTDGATETQVLDASNRFYSLIPHDFGMQKPKLLDNDDIIKEKTDMLDNLLEIEVAFSILKGISINYVIPVVNGDTEKDPLDDHYEKLKTDMKVLDKQAEEFQRLVEYVKNTHGATHASYKLEVEDIFKVDREGEEKVYGRYKDLHNKMLLWHGSRLSNYAGILSQGLRIAPPEAPVTGYMFGKGIYFADMVSKSANYCHTSPQNDTGLLMLCEVVLGDMWEQKQAHYVEKLPKGKHSTKGVGMTTPDPNGNYTNESGVLIPMGKGIKAPVGQTSLLYNEYIVYDVAQVRIRYLLKTKFKYNY